MADNDVHAFCIPTPFPQNALQIFADVRWDAKLLQWLNLTILDNMEKTMVFLYMDLFRKLYQQLPALFESKGLTNLNSSERFRHNNEVLQAITRPLYEPRPIDMSDPEVCFCILFLSRSLCIILYVCLSAVSLLNPSTAHRSIRGQAR